MTKKSKSKRLKTIKRPECDLFMSIEGTHFGHIFIPVHEREEFIDMLFNLPYSENNKLITLMVAND